MKKLENKCGCTQTFILNNKKNRKNFGFKKQQFKQAGITLVALVVTIIVLLILAGVTISLALGSNGVMDRAQYASNTWANATKDETAMFGNIGESIKELANAIEYYNKSKYVNAPVLKQGMTPVKFESGNIVEIEEADES